MGDGIIGMTGGKLISWLCDVTLIVSICFLLFFWGMGAVPFYDKHEAREALVVWEMNNTGNWILPLRNGTEIPDKPPLFHWLGALVSMSVNRVDEITVRFPSALLGTLGILLTYLAGVSLWGRGAGLVAALVLSTSFQWWQAATDTRVDMTLSFCMLCSFLFFLYDYRTGGGRKKAFVLGLLLGLATLTKGPLGFVIPALTALIFVWMRRDFSFLKKLHPFAIVSVCAIVAGSWYALALGQGGKAFLLKVVSENIQTTMAGDAGHPHPFYYYIPALFLNMAPWSLFLLSVGAFLLRYRRRWAEEGILYIVVWFVTVFVFFSAFTEKRPVYILPLYPAVALLMGAWWQKLKDEPFSSTLFLARLATYLNALSFLIISGMLLAPILGLDPIGYIRPALGPKDQATLAIMVDLFAEHHLAVFFWSVLCGLGGIFLMFAVRRGAWGPVVACITAVMVASFFFLRHFEPYLARQYSFKPFMERVLLVVKGAPLFFYRSGDYGVMFYAHRRIPIYQEPLKAGESPFYILVWEEEWKRISDKEDLSLQDASENIDRSASQGRLFLVSVAKKEQKQQKRPLPKLQYTRTDPVQFGGQQSQLSMPRVPS